MLDKSTKPREPWEGRVELGQKIISVKAESPFVYLTFQDGFAKQLDFSRLLTIGKVFTPLRDPQFFKTAHTSPDGRVLEWLTIDGDEIDMCADSLRMEAEGIWNPTTQEWTI
jgi:hypothetical protein